MNLPPDLRAVLDRLRPRCRPLLVGGCVRDWLRGQDPEDFDVEVHGLDFDSLGRALVEFGPTDVVGRIFGVIKVRLESGEVEFSLPRRENKTGAGHRGFEIATVPDLPIKEAAGRRDFTINAIAWDPFQDEVLDPLNGRDDLRAGVLRHTGPAFTEDPLRVLRGFQFAGRFGYRMDPRTAAVCREMTSAHAELPPARIWGEWEKWAADSRIPSAGLCVLVETGWIELYPEIAMMTGLPQDPEWHPEGDVFDHTAYCLDALAGFDAWKERPRKERIRLMLGVLTHDFGKASTTRLMVRQGVPRWTSPGHAFAGLPLLGSLLRRIGAPLEFEPAIAPLVQHHLIHHQWPNPPRPAAIRRLARRLAPATIRDLTLILRSDHAGRPPRTDPDTLKRIEALKDAAEKLQLDREAPRPLVLGRHLIDAGLTPGPHFAPVLQSCFEAQLEGEFSTLEEGRTYLRALLEKTGSHSSSEAQGTDDPVAQPRET